MHFKSCMVSIRNTTLGWNRLKEIIHHHRFKLESSGRFVNRTQNSNKNPKTFWRLRFGRGSVVRHPSNDKGLRDIQHSNCMVLDTKFHIWFIMIVYSKIQHILLQNATPILLQDSTEVYYKMRCLLQSATVQCLLTSQ